MQDGSHKLFQPTAVQDCRAKLPDAIRGYSYHIGPGNEFNMAIRENEVIMAIIKVVAAFKSRRRDEEHTHTRSTRYPTEMNFSSQPEELQMYRQLRAR